MITTTEQQAYAAIEEMFDQIVKDKLVWDRNLPHAVSRAGNRIAANSRRGVGNIEFFDYVFFHSTSANKQVADVDRIATVVKHGEVYYVFKNPNAFLYIEKM